MKEVDPKSTSRALAFELWMQAPMPMVTLMKTLDVTALVRLSRKRGYKFNMLLCWCIGKAAAGMENFYLLPVGDKLMQYDRLAVNTVVATRDGGIATCDIPVSADLEQFNQDYLKLTGQVRESGESYELGEEYMVIGTSALAGYEIDGAVNIYAGCYNNPFLIWGKYRKKWLRATLPILYGDNVLEKHGINRDRTGDREKTRYLCGKQGIFTRDRALIRPGSIRQLETRASTRSASFFHALGGPGRPYNGGGAAGAYCTHNGAKPLKQGHLRAKRGPLGPSRKSQQQTKRTGFAAHGHSIAETASEGKRASRANGALNRAKINGRGQKQGFGGVDRRRGGVTSCYSRRYDGGGDRAQARQNAPFSK